jgi:hypothetical protein
MVLAGIISNNVLVIANRSVPCVDSDNQLDKVIRASDNSGIPSNKTGVLNMTIRTSTAIATALRQLAQSLIDRDTAMHQIKSVYFLTGE